jgi:aminoglycoside 3-N-acetyltransferase
MWMVVKSCAEKIGEKVDMLTFRDLITGFRQLDLDPSKPLIVHASMSAFGRMQGGANTILGALMATAGTLLMPAFTYKTMLVPEIGPPDNGLNYGTGYVTNRTAQIFDPHMPADRLMGALAEALRRHADSCRSLHPILSFTGINATRAVNAQTYAEPLAPIEALAEEKAWVLLLGVDHTVNTSIHYAEQLAGRKQFIRWALTQHGVRECPGFPGCSEGFQDIAPELEGARRKVQIGNVLTEAVPLPELIHAVQALIAADPQALLCSRSYCQRCSAVRKDLASEGEI